VTKRYYAPETPCARLLSCTTIDEQMKERLRSLLATLDPLRLRRDPSRPGASSRCAPRSARQDLCLLERSRKRVDGPSR
jgi:hypothetical protein